MQQFFQCFGCGSQVRIGQPFCQNCGYQFTYSCPSCQASVDNRFSACPNCGTPLGWPTQQPSHYQQKGISEPRQGRGEGRRINPLLVALGGILCLAIIGGGVIFAMDRLSQGPTTIVSSTPPTTESTVVADNTSTDSTSTGSTSTDNTPPVITSVSFSSVDDTSVVIIWITDEPATSQVEYGTTSTYGSLSTLDQSKVTDHYITLTDLEPGITYHYRVKSEDDSGNEKVGTDKTFTTSTIADTTAPAISEVAFSVIDDSSITVIWKTDKAATSQVEYGTTSTYGSTSQLDTNLVTSHSITLSSLFADTTYHYRVKSKDADGNETVDIDRTFVTSAEADTTIPLIANIQTSTNHDSALITWVTNEPSSSQVEYGTTTSYGELMPTTPATDPSYQDPVNGEYTYIGVTIHQIDITGLDAETTYHFRVKSKDRAGNEAVSADGTFTTTAVPT